MKYLIAIAVIFLFKNASSQNFVISGRVTDEQGRPMSGCSVYFSNTSKGGLTSASGEFTLKNLPEGKYELVVSAIGYETYVTVVLSSDYPRELAIRLKAKSAELQEVVVEPSDRNGWRRWGKYFSENFVGATENAWQCKLLNPEVLHFRFNKKRNRLTVRATAPLVVENKALGYNIKFQLEEFTSDFNENTVTFLGYPLFIEMENGDTKRKSNWIKNRKQAYYGSLLHFMRSIYRDRMSPEGYTVMAKVNRKDLELYSLDTMMTRNADGSRRLFFNDTLRVAYNPIANRISEISEIYLETSEGIDIQANGSFYSPKALVANSYWAKYEKLSNMLPFDYTP